MAIKLDKDLNVIVGRFQPFTLGHAKGAEEVYKKYGLKTLFCIIKNDKPDTHKPFPSNFITDIYKDLVRQPWFEGFEEVLNADIGKLALACRSRGKEMLMWTCGTDRYKAYSFQNIPKYIEMYDIQPGFSVQCIERTDDDISATKVRDAIKRDDFNIYKLLTPKCVHNPLVFSKLNEYLSQAPEAKTKKTLRSKVRESIIDNEVVNEAGVGGHMLYPFELPKINKGKDLINIYNKTIISLKNKPASIKVDGSNLSIRLIDEGGKKMFALDRGSGKEEDVVGVTVNRLEQRFGTGHGMIPMATKLLDTFNSNIKSIEKDLKKLGMWDDTTLAINLEYVNTKSTYGFAVKYAEDMIVLHNIRKITRDGKKVKTEEVKYSRSTLDNVIKILNKTSDIRVFGDIPTTFAGNPTSDLKDAMESVVKIKYGNTIYKKSFNDIINEPNPFYYEKFKTIDKKVKTVMNKQIMVDAIFNNKDLVDVVGEGFDRIDELVVGIIYNYFTIKAGDAILKCINSEVGLGSTQEGIIVRDEKISKEPFKIVGSFLMQSTINHM